MTKFIKFKNQSGTDSIINIDSIACAYYSATTGGVTAILRVGLNNSGDVVEEKIKCTMQEFIEAIESEKIIATIK